MAKTDLTRAIEKAIKDYCPSEVCGIRINKHRPTHTAFEVPVACGTTTAGLVDCMRIQEYFGDMKRTTHCRLHQYERSHKTRIWAVGTPCEREYPEGGRPDLCDSPTCPWRYTQEEGTAKILVTCFEIKITKSDFKSKHGHNFVGNCNYYVIPKELYPDVADLVPEEIGIILYLSAGSYIGLRRKKECSFKPLTDEEQKWFILSTLKRTKETAWKEYEKTLIERTNGNIPIPF